MVRVLVQSERERGRERRREGGRKGGRDGGRDLQGPGREGDSLQAKFALWVHALVSTGCGA